MSLMRLRFRAPHQSFVTKIPQNQRAYVQQGYIGVFQYQDDSEVYYLATSGLSICVGVSMYDPLLKKGSLLHLDCNVTGREYKHYLTQSSLDKDKIINEKNRIQQAIKSYYELVYRKDSPIQIKIIYTTHHDSPGKDGYPLRVMLEESFEQLGIRLEKELFIQPAYSVDDICLNLINGQIVHYTERSTDAVLGEKMALNHPQSFQYYMISEKGLLETPAVINKQYSYPR